MLLESFVPISEITFQKTGKFTLFLFHLGEEERFLVRAHPTLSHIKITDQLLSAVEVRGEEGIQCRILGGGFITKRNDKKVILLDGESEMLGPVNRMGLARLIEILEGSFPDFRILYETLVVSDEE